MTLTKLDKPTKIRPREGFDQNSLKNFLINELNLIDGEINILQFPSGYSNLTYLVNFNERDYVLRRPPNGANIKSGHDMYREYRILNGLNKIYNKVPKPFIYSDDLKVIGYPFYIMERKEGIILRGNIPKNQAYGVFISQLVRFFSVNKSVHHYKRDVEVLVKKLILKGFSKLRLYSKFRRFCLKYIQMWPKFGSNILQDFQKLFHS